MLPLEDLQNRVRSGDEEQLDVVPALATQLLKRLNGVRGPVSLDLDPGHGKPRIARGRDDSHEIAVFRRGDVAAGLHPWLSGGHEHHLVQLKFGQRRLGGHQVAVMDGIEGPAHHAESLRI
jgi:hypothetical protein